MSSRFLMDSASIVVDYVPPVKKSVTSILNKMGVPGPLEMARAFSRLEILPNPTPQDDQSGETEKHVESPWQNVPKPTIDPNAWDKAEIALVHFQELKATNTYCNRKNVKEHIESMGEAITRYRSFALVAEIDGQAVIIDGHHRLFAMWLLGYDNAPVWYIKVGE